MLRQLYTKLNNVTVPVNNIINNTVSIQQQRIKSNINNTYYTGHTQYIHNTAVTHIDNTDIAKQQQQQHQSDSDIQQNTTTQPNSNNDTTTKPIPQSRRVKPSIDVYGKYNTEYKPVTTDKSNIPVYKPYPPELGGKRLITYTGIVFSAKAQKTINVQIDRYKQVPKYNKLFRTTKKFLAHDEYEEANEGDIVEIRQHRPISKRKNWVLHRIIQRRPSLEHDVTDPNQHRREIIKKVQFGQEVPQNIPYP